MPKTDTLQQTIGKFLKSERKRQGLTLEKVALLALGNACYANKISLIEKGLLKEYTIETLNKVLKALGFEFANLFKE